MNAKTELGAAQTKKAELSKILKQRLESTLDRIEGLAQSGRTIAEGAYELGFQVQNTADDMLPGTSALPGLAMALCSLFEKIGKNLDCLKGEIAASRDIDREAIV